MRGQLFAYAILGFAFAEATGLFALMVAFMIRFTWRDGLDWCITGGWCGCRILWCILIFVVALGVWLVGWKVCRYCGIGRASIIVILLIRHRLAKKMSMKSMIPSSESCKLQTGGRPCKLEQWQDSVPLMYYIGTEIDYQSVLDWGTFGQDPANSLNRSHNYCGCFGECPLTSSRRLWKGQTVQDSIILILDDGRQVLFIDTTSGKKLMEPNDSWEASNLASIPTQKLLYPLASSLSWFLWIIIFTPPLVEIRRSPRWRTPSWSTQDASAPRLFRLFGAGFRLLPRNGSRHQFGMISQEACA